MVCTEHYACNTFYRYYLVVGPIIICTDFHFSHGFGGKHIESPFDKGWWQNTIDFAGWRCNGFFKPNRQNWISTYDVDKKAFDGPNSDKEPLLGTSNGIV